MRLERTITKPLQVAGLCLTVGLAAMGTVSAAGGGGGGASPSSSSQNYDPVEEYRAGVEAFEREDYNKAARHFRRVVDAAPKNAQANYMLGVTYVLQDKDKRDRRYLRKAVRYDEDMAMARGQLGAVEARLGDMVKAQEQREALTAMAEACGTCDQADTITQAIATIDAAMGDDEASLSLPTIRFANIERGDAAYLDAVKLINQQRYAEAERHLADAALVFGPHPDILTYQGFVERKQGHYETARLYYHSALTIDPTHRGATEYLGELYVEQRDAEAARAQLARLDDLCTFGCEEAEELRRWIDAAAL